MFRQTTDIAWGDAGNGFISDSDINSRVVRPGPDGAWLEPFGTPATGQAS